MPNNEMKIKLQVENQKANQSLKKTSGRVKDIEKKSKDAGKELGRMRIATAGLRRTMGALRNNLLLVTFAFGGTIAAISKTVKAYGEQELAEKKLETALGRTSQALLDQASALQSVSTFGDENIIQAQALIAAFTDDEEAIKRATEATLDLAAAKGMDLFAAADLVAKTLGSTTNAMSRYGIEVTGAVGSTERLDTLTKNIAETFGGQAKAQAETMSGALKQAGNAAGDAAESMGELLEPVIVKAAKLFQGASEAVGAYLESLKELTTEEIATTNNVEKLAGRLIDLEKEIAKTEKAIRTWGITDPELLQNLILMSAELALVKDRLTEIHAIPATDPMIFVEPDFYENIMPGFKEFAATQLETLSNYEKEQALLAEFIKQHEDEAKALGLVTDATKEEEKASKKAAKAKEDQIQMGLQGANKMAAAMVSLAKGNKQQAIAALQFSQAAAFASAVEGSMKAFGKGGIGGFIMGTALLAEGLARVQQINQQIADIKSVKAAATGMNEVVTQPTMILAGEAGSEQVSLTPLEGPNIDGPQGGSAITVNVSGNVLSQDFVEGELAENIKEAIRRGTDFGIS